MFKPISKFNNELKINTIQSLMQNIKIVLIREYTLVIIF